MGNMVDANSFLDHCLPMPKVKPEDCVKTAFRYFKNFHLPSIFNTNHIVHKAEQGRRADIQ